MGYPQDVFGLRQRDHQGNEKYHILTQHGQPDISKSNAIAERANRTVLEMTRALLGQAGPPACFWSEAAPCATFLRNLSLSGR
eukprot:4126698-Alexandrium_andersonii.AAC.1